MYDYKLLLSSGPEGEFCHATGLGNQNMSTWLTLQGKKERHFFFIQRGSGISYIERMNLMLRNIEAGGFKSLNYIHWLDCEMAETSLCWTRNWLLQVSDIRTSYDWIMLMPIREWIFIVRYLAFLETCYFFVSSTQIIENIFYIVVFSKYVGKNRITTLYFG